MLFLLSGHIYAQSVGIGTTTPDTSAILDLSSTNKGFLLPRMTTAQRNAIPTPTQGLKIFNIDDRCEDTYDGNGWNKLCNQRVLEDTIKPGDTWKELNPIPSGLLRYGMFSFSFGNKIICGLGRDLIQSQWFNDIWEYDTVTRLWTQKNDFPGLARNGMFNFTYNGKGYIVGSISSGPDNEVWEYNPVNDSWLQKSDFPGGDRSYLAGFVIGSKAYMGTGSGLNPDYEKDLWEYNIDADTWIQKTDLPGVGRNWAVGFSIGSKGYIGLGRGPTYGIFLEDIYEYDPNGNSWIAKQDFPTECGGPLVNSVIDNIAYIGIGNVNGNVISIFKKFNPNASGNQWTSLNDFPGIARTTPFSTVNNSKLYLGCGIFVGNASLNDFWVYNPIPDTLTQAIQQIPENTFSIKDHSWTSEEDTRLYTSQNSYKVGIGTKTPKVKLHVEGNIDAGLGNNSGLVMIGNIAGKNVLIDNNEIMARNNGNANQLILQNHGGDTQFGGKVGLGTIPAVKLHIANGGDAGVETINSGFLQLGSTTGLNIIMDNNEIMARNNGYTSDLILNNDGGRTFLGGDLEVDGLITGAVKYNLYYIGVTSSSLSQTFTVGNKTFIKATCVSGACLTCSGSGCPDLVLTDGEADGHMLILQGDAASNRGLYMPGNVAATTNYRLTANFQLASNNFITLIWVSSLSEWREISRAVY